MNTLLLNFIFLTITLRPRLDASVIYGFDLSKKRGWKARLGVSVLNVYDRKVPISVLNRAEDEGNGGIELEQVIYRYSLGITPNAVFRVFF